MASRWTGAMHQSPRDKLIEAGNIRRHELDLTGSGSILERWAAAGVATGLALGLIAAIKVGGYPWVPAAGAALGLVGGIIGGVRRRSELTRRAEALEGQGKAEITQMLIRQAQNAESRNANGY